MSKLFFWKKRNQTAAQIEFAPMFEGISDFAPPVPAHKALPGWYRSMSHRIGEARDMDIPVHDRHHPEGKTVKACPAVSDLFKFGYVIPLWADFHIEVKDDSSFVWHSANPRHVIQFHSPQQLHAETTRPDELNYVVKFIAPWRWRLPKGHLVLMKGLFYHSDLPFRVCEGILDGSVTSTMNINTFWPRRPGSYVLKRGTPLAMMIPFQKHAYVANVYSDPEIGKKWDERNQTLINDTFDNTYRDYTDRSLQKLFR